MLLPFLSSGVAAVEKCKKKGEQPLEFRFFTDNHSWQENGWTLECKYEDGEEKLVWETPIGSLKHSTRTEIVREAACVPDTATCTLRVFDSKGDGLQGREDGDSTPHSGWFAFLHGATTVGTYKNLESPAFSELTYCVGPDCDQEPQEIQTNDENCQDIIYLAMQLDNKPQDTTYKLVCGADKQVIWDGKDFTEAGAYIEEETCLPKNACCKFIVTDEDTLGLTSSVDTNDPSLSTGSRSTGFLYLERNFEPILEYDGSSGEEFSVLSKTFGCSADETGTIDLNETDEIAAELVIEKFLEDHNGEISDGSEQDSEEKDREDLLGDNAWLQGSDQDNDDKDRQDLVGDKPTDAPNEPDMSTDAPTSENYKAFMGFSDDDFDNTNDDGAGYGKFTDDWTDDALTDDVKWFNTEPPREMYDDVVDDDNTDWINEPFDDDDLQDQLQDLEDLVTEADNSRGTPGISGDILTVDMLNGQYQQQGIGKGAKIAIGIVVPLLVIWTAALSWFTFKDYLFDRFGTNAEDEVIEKNTQRNENSSQESYSEDDVRSHSSLEDV